MGQEIDVDILCEATDNHNFRKILPVYRTLAFGWILGLIIVYAPSPWALWGIVFFLYHPATLAVSLAITISIIYFQISIGKELQRELSGKLPNRFVHPLRILLPVPMSYFVPALTVLNNLNGDLLLLAVYALLAILILTVALSTQIKSTRSSKLTITAGIMIFIPNLALRLLVLLPGESVGYGIFVCSTLLYCSVTLGFSLGLILLGIQSIKYSRLPRGCRESMNEQAVPPIT